MTMRELIARLQHQDETTMGGAMDQEISLLINGSVREIHNVEVVDVSHLYTGGEHYEIMIVAKTKA